jgi:hypothetical protein
MATSEPTLAPVFDFVTDEREVTLREGRAQIRIGNDTFRGAGRAVVQVMSRPTILFKADVENVSMQVGMRVMLGSLTIEDFEFDGVRIDGFPGGLGGTFPSTSNVAVWYPRCEPVLLNDASSKMNRLVFRLFNFTNFQSLDGTSETRCSTTVAIHRVRLSGADVAVLITSLFETSDIQRQIEQDGGTRLTHVGSFERADGKSFTEKQALEYLWQLQQFLSFAIGRKCIPVCPCGFDKHGNRVWEAWLSPAVNQRAADSWFDTRRCDQLATFFDCFLNTKKNDAWNRPLQDAIYWYLKANSDSHGIDAGIILAQAALELLAYAYVVEDTGLLSAKGFKDLWASDKLRLLFVSKGIPTNIPAECKQMIALTRGKKAGLDWKDLPHALTEIRNSLVHPDHKHRHKLGTAYVDAWKASLWVLELAILGICGYVGTYSNRLKHRMAGSVEDVPWSGSAGPRSTRGRAGNKRQGSGAAPSGP